VSNGLGSESAQLVGHAASSDQLQLLRHADVAGVGLVNAVSEFGGLANELLGVVELPPEQCDTGSARVGGVPMAGLVSFVEDREARFEGGLEGRGAKFELSIRQQEQPVRVAFAVSCRQRDGDDLPCDIGSLRRAARRPVQVVAGEQTREQRLGIPAAPAERERMRAEGPARGRSSGTEC